MMTLLSNLARKIALPAYFVFTATFILNGQHKDFSAISVGIWNMADNRLEGSESQAMIRTFNTLGFHQITVFDAVDLSKKPIRSSGIDLLWIISNDPDDFHTQFSGRLTSRLNQYVADGGKLVLANQALMMLPLLEVESTVPETRPKACKDEGYGRQLGYHAFREHSLFKGLNGGAYVLKPEKDTVVYQSGYFGENNPANGQVIAVDWDYIFLREESKLIIGYEVGEGMILAIGGYLLFDLPNRNRLHLEAFTRNIFEYMLTDQDTGTDHYWFSYGSNISGLHLEEVSRILGKEPRAKGDFDITEDKAEMNISPGKSAGNYWDLAGERMLVMGTDHGGITEIWAHPVMSLRDYKIDFSLSGHSDTIHDFKTIQPHIEIFPSEYVRNYSLGGGKLKESISVSPDQPVTVIHYSYEGTDPIEMDISFNLLFRLMWPYSEKVPGGISVDYFDDYQTFIAVDPSRDFTSAIGITGVGDAISLTPVHPYSSKQKRHENSTFEMPSQSAGFHLRMNGPGSFCVVFASCSEGLEKTIGEYRQAVSAPGAVFAAAREHIHSLLGSSVNITTPSENFNHAYRWALVATDRFQVSTPGIGSSLVAGYATSDKGWDGGHAVSGRPGYGWYFGRDGAWSGFALLHYGDFDKVRRMLETFQQYQDLTGKIFHELSTSGIVHYDAADATPLYIILAGRYLRHSGDTAFIRQSWPHIRKAIEFCYSTDTDHDLLIENTNVGHGWVEGGHLFGSHTSLHLASCWAAALEEAANLASFLNLKSEQEKYARHAREVKEIINRDFWFEQNDYYFHGLMPDGSYMEETSIMPVIPLLFGQADAEKVAKVLPVIASNAFSTDWGCRIVGENDPRFNPRGYHSGSVWPLFTGWASLAEFRNHRFLQGYSHLSSNHQVWKYWGLGFMEEVLNGSVFVPSGVCHHQCWSETMAIQPAIEGMLGYKPDALNGKINLRPWFPMNWDSIVVTGIRMGEEQISMDAWRHGGMEAGTMEGPEKWVSTYHFSKASANQIDVNFHPVLPAGCKVESITVNGQPARDWGAREVDPGWVVPEFGFRLDSAAVVEITWTGGITALPILPEPIPGESSKGFRMLNTAYSDDVYTILLQAPRASAQEFTVWAAEPGKWKVEGAEIIGIDGNIMTLKASFPDLETDYAVGRIVVSR